jgi:O-antigen/teichoic acid export membrane protein
MGSGAALSLLRGFIAAAILAAADFGLYAVVIAIGMFGSSLLGLGKVEEMRKAFPRLFVEGRISSILTMADRVNFMLARRVLVTTAFFGLIAFFVGGPSWWVAIIWVGLTSLTTGWNAILASALRSTTDLRHLGTSTALRAVLALILGSAGAYHLGWNGAIAGEVIAAVAGAGIARSALAKIHCPPCEGTLAAPDTIAGASKDGMILFLGALAISIPMYLGRVFVGAAYPPFELGVYSFLMIFVTAAATFMGIIDQKIGPDLIRMEHSGFELLEQRRFLYRWTALLGLALLAGVVIVSAGMMEAPFAFFRNKYHLEWGLLAPTALLCALQVASTYDWMLLSRNEERLILACSLFFLLLAALGCVGVFAFNLSLEIFLWVLTIAKTLHLGSLVVVVSRLRQSRVN